MKRSWINTKLSKIETKLTDVYVQVGNIKGGESVSGIISSIKMISHI